MKEFMGRSTTVLVVEDDPDYLETLQDFLSNYFAKVLVATNGADALELTKTHAIEIVVTDYQMPGMTGLELAQKLRETHPLVPILMLTGNFQGGEEIKSLLDSGAFDVIYKPYNLHLLVNRIRNALLLPLLVQVLWAVMSKEWKPMQVDDFMRLPYNEQLKTIYMFSALIKTKGLRQGA